MLLPGIGSLLRQPLYGRGTTRFGIWSLAPLPCARLALSRQPQIVELLHRQLSSSDMFKAHVCN